MTVQQKRLLALYDHMRQPQKKLAHKKFSFSYFNCTFPNGNVDKNGCGTCGCMAGELPAIFPKYWKWRPGGLVYTESDEKELPALKEFFGLTVSEAAHLFLPGYQSTYIDKKTQMMGKYSTKRQVVANLRRFLKIKGII